MCGRWDAKNNRRDYRIEKPYLGPPVFTGRRRKRPRERRLRRRENRRGEGEGIGEAD